MKIKNIYRIFILLTVLVIGAMFVPNSEAQAQSGGLLVVRHSKKCLDVKGASTAARTPAQQSTCSGNANQQWAVVPVSEKGYVSLVAGHSGQCLDVRGDSTADRGAVQQTTCHGRRNQQWLLVPVSNKGYSLVVALHSGKCLDIRSGSTSDQAPAQQYNCTARKNQQWIFQ